MRVAYTAGFCHLPVSKPLKIAVKAGSMDLRTWAKPCTVSANKQYNFTLARPETFALSNHVELLKSVLTRAPDPKATLPPTLPAACKETMGISSIICGRESVNMPTQEEHDDPGSRRRLMKMHTRRQSESTACVAHQSIRTGQTQ
jgi:hypothetical protein